MRTRVQRELKIKGEAESWSYCDSWSLKNLTYVFDKYASDLEEAVLCIATNDYGDRRFVIRGYTDMPGSSSGQDA